MRDNGIDLFGSDQMDFTFFYNTKQRKQSHILIRRFISNIHNEFHLGHFHKYLIRYTVLTKKKSNVTQHLV